MNDVWGSVLEGLLAGLYSHGQYTEQQKALKAKQARDLVASDVAREDAAQAAKREAEQKARDRAAQEALEKRVAEFNASLKPQTVKTTNAKGQIIENTVRLNPDTHQWETVGSAPVLGWDARKQGYVPLLDHAAPSRRSTPPTATVDAPQADSSLDALASLTARGAKGLMNLMGPSTTPQTVEPPSPYPEGTRLTGPDGRLYVVKNGQPVPVN